MRRARIEEIIERAAYQQHQHRRKYPHCYSQFSPSARHFVARHDISSELSITASKDNHMAYTHHELKHKTLAELRDIAKDIDHEALQGYTQLNKEHLVVAMCKALNIDIHEHHEVVGVDKAAIKLRIKALKAKRDAAISAHDHKQLKVARRSIHRLKRQIHKATV